MDDVIGIHSIPDAAFKDKRAGTISFDNSITQNTIKIISDVSCNDSLCDVTLSGDTISSSNHETNNGDMISTHFSKDKLGLASIDHKSMMYNLNRYIGVYQSVATPLIVCYDPVVSEVQFWSYLADAGNTSFDNRYAAAIKYDGSVGGCMDDPDGLYKDRRVKINDFYNALVQSDNFGEVIDVSSPDLLLTEATSIADMVILNSVRAMISDDNDIVESFDGPVITMNDVSQKVQINSAGFSQLLFDVSFEEGYLEKNFINVTSYNTFVSENFGGIDIIYLAHDTYDYPWGYFTTSFNMTAYKYVQETIPCNKEFCKDFISVALADTDVTIKDVIITDSNNTSISLVDFYLNYHKDDDDAEFSFMHLADLYEMNVPQNIDSYTGEFLLNKTSIYYDSKMQGFLFENFYDDDTQYDNPREYLINQSPRIFPEGPYSVDVTITAQRNNEEKTTSIPFYDLYLKYPAEYSMNMHPDNYVNIHRATTAVSIPHFEHFGKITNVTINNAPAKNISCNDGCIVILSNELPISIVAQNQWGGQIVNGNLTSLVLVPYDSDIWIDLLPERLFWIFFVLAMFYVGYRVLKMIFSRQK